ncbi:MAG: PQQ-dependent sugar dehydrogenase [Acidobacteriota bacterium]
MRFSIVAVAFACALVSVGAKIDPPVVLEISDFATAPMTGSFSGGTGNPGSLARINFMRPEPGASGRLFVNDLNGPLYILDPQSKQFTTYLDFNGRGTATGLFDRLPFAAGFANGLISFQFAPDYPTSGKFYTLHLEETAVQGGLVPDKTSVPGLDLKEYEPTPAVPTPGPVTRESVIIEWTDTNIRNTTFEGTAREILRIQLNTQIHPTGDMVFNPSARPGAPEWGVMYVGAGDGGSGEQTDAIRRNNPQRLDTLVGKILRIVPDLANQQATSIVSANGRYRVPNDNPFAKVPGARPEIWAYGFRNPHRLTWEIDTARPVNNRLLAMSIGLHTWETVNIVRKGANYGYSAREGNEALLPSNQTGERPAVDRLPVMMSETVTRGTVAPTYPVLQYNHGLGGFAIMGGFVYHGTKAPALRGKFLFGDILTGRLWYANYAEMLAADDGKPSTMAAMHPVEVTWNGQTYPTMNPVVVAGYQARRRADAGATAAMPARADIRFGFDANGEVYILSKVDGVIRAVVGATAGN